MGIAEELREKARSLRRSNDFVCKDFVAIEFGISSPCKSPRRCCDCYADMFERLADLIEPRHETTEDVSDDYGKFECGKCGCRIDDVTAVDNGGINFCPDCGKEIEE